LEPQKKGRFKFWNELDSQSRTIWHSNAVTVCKIHQKHFQSILNHYDYSISTNIIEGVNNKIKTLHKQSYGFRDMAKEYFDKLLSLINNLEIESEINLPFEVKHFFSGAALYINSVICVSWTPSFAKVKTYQ